MKRNVFVWLVLLVFVLSACTAPAAPTPQSAEPQKVVETVIVEKEKVVAPPPATNSIGKLLPPDAAPPEKQVLRLMCDERKHMDASANQYDASLACGAAWLWDRLVTLDENYKLVPAAADSWEPSADGLSWTFHLQKDAVWSDGSPVTAADFEYALKRQLDPKTGSSWGWFYYDIKNAEAVNSGTVPPDELGVKATDDYTLVVTTTSPTPYLPMLMAFPSSAPVPRKMVEQHGMQWSTSPETCLTNSSFKLEEWSKGQRIVLGLNPQYKGRNKATIEKIIFTFGDPDTMFPSYQAGEIDGIHADAEFPVLVSAPNLKVIEKDPKLSRELYKFPYLGVEYIFFPSKPPFDDIKVRQAFSHAIDRDKLTQVALGGLGSPAFGMIPPGIPGYPGNALDEIQKYDPELAKKLLAEAGFPDGKGFPEQEFWVREPDQTMKAAAEMIQSMVKENLGIELKIMPVEKKVYVDVMRKKEMPLSVIHWMYDYVDPSDFLNLVWHSEKGRHTWKNEGFDKITDKAMGNPNTEERLKQYQEANKILSEDVAAVFLWYPVHTQMWKSYVKGIGEDAYGYMWVPYYYLGIHNLYIAQE